jgi:hypothetical protein
MLNLFNPLERFYRKSTGNQSKFYKGKVSRVLVLVRRLEHQYVQTVNRRHLLKFSDRPFKIGDASSPHFIEIKAGPPFAPDRSKMISAEVHGHSKTGNFCVFFVPPGPHNKKGPFSLGPSPAEAKTCTKSFVYMPSE